METKQFKLVALNKAAAGEFTALISTFNQVDKAGDVVRPGAFAATIAAWRAKGANVPVVFSHRSDDIDQHVGHVEPDDLVETSTGLQATGRFYLEEPAAEKVFRQIQRKALSEWSFGYIVRRAKALASGGRELLALDLVELGPCLLGVGDTHTVSVKSQQQERLTNRTTLDPYWRRFEHLKHSLAIARVAAHVHSD